MRVLLDTNVVSELQSSQIAPSVASFFKHLAEERTFISVITVGEIAYGIHRMPESSRRRELSAWLTRLERQFGSRIVGCDVETARIWGELVARLHGQGNNIEKFEGLLAATAIRHGFHIATRNVRHFSETGALLVNPWDN